jgi:hypothetical protein
MIISCAAPIHRLAQSQGPRRRWAMHIAALILTVCIGQRSTAQVTIHVNTTQQGVTNYLCSLQEAIYSSELKASIAVGSTAPDTFYPTGCVEGTGKGDTIVLPPGAVFTFNHFWDGDSHNIYGPTATPVIFVPMTIEGNGATLRWVGGAGNSRLFAVGKVNDPGFASGTGDLALRNVYVKGFHIKGGNGGNYGGGGGLGAGGAIFVDGFLTVENSTFENNGAVGGNGGGLGYSGGGGGLSGNGGAECSYGSGGGGGGSRGNGGIGGCTGLKDGGGGGGGTVFSGGNASASIGGSSGFRCGGNGGDAGHDGHAPACLGAGGGGGGVDSSGGIHFHDLGDGAQGSFGGGGGGGGGDGGDGGFGGGGGAAFTAEFSLHGGNGGFGGGGGVAWNCTGWCWSHPGKGGSFGGRADHEYGGGGGALGGAIFSVTGIVQVRNSTFYNNYVTRGVAGGGSADNGADAGGAIFSYDNTLKITDSTFSGNQSTGSGGAIVAYSDFGESGLAGAFTLNNTIIANNGANECFFTGTMVIHGAGNLIMNNGSGTGTFGPCHGVVSKSDPHLQPLVLNSPGNTPTMAILTSSPAFNSADPGTSLSTDQRGVTRPQLGGFDIGAFEARGNGR